MSSVKALFRYDDQMAPIVVGIKIVPRFVLNLFYGVWQGPFGVFGVITQNDRVGRNDFNDGTAKFIFCPVP